MGCILTNLDKRKPPLFINLGDLSEISYDKSSVSIGNIIVPYKHIVQFYTKDSILTLIVRLNITEIIVFIFKDNINLYNILEKEIVKENPIIRLM